MAGKPEGYTAAAGWGGGTGGVPIPGQTAQPLGARQRAAQAGQNTARGPMGQYGQQPQPQQSQPDTGTAAPGPAGQYGQAPLPDPIADMLEKKRLSDEYEMHAKAIIDEFKTTRSPLFVKIEEAYNALLKRYPKDKDGYTWDIDEVVRTLYSNIYGESYLLGDKGSSLRWDETARGTSEPKTIHGCVKELLQNGDIDHAVPTELIHKLRRILRIPR